MKSRLFTTGLLLLGMTGVASAQQASRLPNDFDILNRTSIFSRDRQVQNRDNLYGGGRIRQPRVQVRRNYTPILAGAMVEDDGYFVAFIADPNTGFMTGYRVGDVLPDKAGTIKDITLDDITTIAADNHTTKKIDIGETITGGAAEYPSDSAPATTEAAATGPDGGGDDNGGGPPSGDNNGPPPESAQPAAMSASPGASTGASTGGASSGGIDRLPGESTLDYMKRRRAQQLKK